jgi:hypothetical protein
MTLKTTLIFSQTDNSALLKSFEFIFSHYRLKNAPTPENIPSIFAFFQVNNLVFFFEGQVVSINNIVLNTSCNCTVFLFQFSFLWYNPLNVMFLVFITLLDYRVNWSFSQVVKTLLDSFFNVFMP